MRVNTTKAPKFTTTTPAPAGTPFVKEIMMPMMKQTMETITPQIVTDLKLLQRRMDVRAGNTMRLEIRRAPIRRIPTTTMTAVSTAIRLL